MGQIAPRNQFAAALLSYCEQRDIPASTISRLSGVRMETVLDADADAAELSYSQLRSLWKEAVAQSRDPLFGLHLGESLQLAALGIVGDVIKSSPSVGAAVTAASSLISHITDELSARIKHSKDHFSITLLPSHSEQFSDLSRHVGDCLLVLCVHELDGLVLKKIQPLKVFLPLPASANAAEYERVFRCPPSFGHPHCEIVFEASLFQSPITTGNYEVQQSLLRIVSTLTSSPDRKPMFSAKVKDYLVRNSYLGILTLEQVAANFNVTPRSLQRRLKDESTSYQQIADSVRKSLALQYIKAGKHAIKEISAILGYNEVSAFSRAFKRWTGRPPVAFNA